MDPGGRPAAHHVHDAGAQRLVHQPPAQVGRPHPRVLPRRDGCVLFHTLLGTLLQPGMGSVICQGSVYEAHTVSRCHEVLRWTWTASLKHLVVSGGDPWQPLQRVRFVGLLTVVCLTQMHACPRP